MYRLVTLLALLLLASGCVAPNLTAPGVQPVCFENPILVPACNHELVYETVVDVIDDYFRIREEIPIRQVGNEFTEGRIDTFPELSSTYLEPWRHDTVTSYDRLESTLQTIRRRVTARVFPAEGGFRVELAVYKELEGVIHPDLATARDPKERFDITLTRVVNPIGEQEITQDWIALGRDTALEQQMLGEVLARVGNRPLQ